MATPQITKEALQKLEEQLTCAVCLESYKDPKLLQCFHVFCEKCLVPLVLQDQQSQLSVRCPTCRQSTLLPAASVSGLQSAFHIHHLFEIQETLKKKKEPSQATSAYHVADDSGNPLPQKKSTFHCPFHKERELELYCETCEELICVHCTVKLHNGHQYDLVSEVFEKNKNEITASLEPVETQLDTVNKALEQLDTHCEQITDQRTATEANIHKTFQRLHEELEVRRTELIGQLNGMTQQKMKTLAAQRDGIEMIQIQLKSCVEFVRESLRTGSQGEVMNMKKHVVTQVKKLTTDFKPDTLRITQLNVNFTSASLSIEQFGKVYLQQIAPKKCYVSTKGMKTAVVEEKTTTILNVVDEHGEACVFPVESVNCELVSEITAEKTKFHIKQVEHGQYEISYTPTTRGRHHLHIKVEGEHINGSPFPVMVRIPVEKLGTPIKIIDGVKSPCGVAVNERGEIIVVENGSHCVSIFSPSGEKLRMFGSKGSRRGQFSHPRSVAVDVFNNIFVVDYGNQCIQRFTSDGKFVKIIGGIENDRLQFSSPIAVAIHPHEKKVYVTESGKNRRIQILNPYLSYYNTFRSFDDLNGLIPVSVAFDSTGNVYVADAKNHCIQFFTADGTFLGKFGQFGHGDGELNWPSSVAIDSDNTVYVTELKNHRVSVFSSEGEFLTSFGTEGTQPGQFKKPFGITVDNKSRIVYVSDTANGRICSFNI